MYAWHSQTISPCHLDLARVFHCSRLARQERQHQIVDLISRLFWMILGMAYPLQRASMSSSPLWGGSYVGCQVLEGIIDGFCGCLTTDSTWVLELSDLHRRHAYTYGAWNVAVGLCSQVIEIGSLKWTRGIVNPIFFQ